MPVHHMEVLLVEDDASLRLVLSAVLAQTGYKVRTAADGVSALVEMASHMPDLLVSDLNMPRMSGYELLTTVRREFPPIPLIAMSGTLWKKIPAGADAFYQKGTHPVFLVQLVTAMTQRRVCPQQMA
jgi:CheY-like chemotaxis protein